MFAFVCLINSVSTQTSAWQTLNYVYILVHGVYVCFTYKIICGRKTISTILWHSLMNIVILGSEQSFFFITEVRDILHCASHFVWIPNVGISIVAFDVKSIQLFILEPYFDGWKVEKCVLMPLWIQFEFNFFLSTWLHWQGHKRHHHLSIFRVICHTKLWRHREFFIRKKSSMNTECWALFLELFSAYREKLIV